MICIDYYSTKSWKAPFEGVLLCMLPILKKLGQNPSSFKATLTTFYFSNESKTPFKLEEGMHSAFQCVLQKEKPLVFYSAGQPIAPTLEMMDGLKVVLKQKSTVLRNQPSRGEEGGS